jgi:glutamate-5-semialdehyde dehydrogenase
MTSSSYTELFAHAKSVTGQVARLSESARLAVLDQLAAAILSEAESILSANRADLTRMDPADAKVDRLLLNPDRLAAIAADIRSVARLASPLGVVLEQRTVPSGLRLTRVSVPIGVVGMVYEARPNVTLDVAALCLKSGNVAVLKGGSDAADTNSALAKVIGGVLERNGIDRGAVTMLPPGREATQALLTAVGLVDVVIPRGSQALIDAVRREARVPVIETGAGIVHVFVDASADIAASARVVFNAKTRRVGVCNALDTLLVHQSLGSSLPELVAPLQAKDVVLYADEPSMRVLNGFYPSHLLVAASPEHYGTEFLSHKMAIRQVASLDEALDHIRTHGSGHSESILTSDEAHAERFLNDVDAAAVYVNASTAFTDGGEFGLGAEIGISTQKLHARGPMGLAALTSSKWIARGDYSVR